MRTTKRTWIVAFLLGLTLLCACFVYVWLSFDKSGSAPPPNSEATEPPSLTALPPRGTAQPAIPERRRLTLEFPPRIRAGDSDLVRLTLEVDDLGNLTPTAELGGNVIEGEVVEIPNLYESHHVIAEARFDMAGMEVRPAERLALRSPRVRGAGNRIDGQREDSLEGEEESLGEFGGLVGTPREVHGRQQCSARARRGEAGFWLTPSPVMELV
jgi:hypothetical protein